MFIVPVALAFGVLGVLARGHRRVVLVLAILAPGFSVLAFAAQFVPGSYQSCTSTLDGATVCHAEPAVSGWAGPLPFAIAIVLILLSLAPIASLRTGKWWPAAASALLQCIPQVISFGGFLDWAPALAATIAVAFAMTGARSRFSVGRTGATLPR